MLCKALKSASDTMFYAPMVCMMFVGFRMRVLQLSKGTGNPQDWVRMSMQAVTYSILANTLLVLFVPLFTAKEVKTTKEGDLDPEAKAPFENSALATIFNVVRYLTFLGLYIGFGAVCVGVFKYEPPAGVWDGPIPPVSPAVACTMLLSCTFFFIYLAARDQSYLLAVRWWTALHEQLRDGDAPRRGHARDGADALRALPCCSHARAADGPGRREPAALGPAVLLRCLVLPDRSDDDGCHCSALLEGEGAAEGRQDGR